MHVNLCFVAVAVVVAGLLPTPVSGTIDCAIFDKTKIKLVTFDVFAALFDIVSSLDRNIPKVIPGLSPHVAEQIRNRMLSGYGSYAGHVFSYTETNGQEPFVFVSQTSTASIVKALGLEKQIPLNSTQFQALAHTWEDLIPWEGTLDALAKLKATGRFMLAPLSNGDAHTLTAATQAFAPKVPMNTVFSSNFPVGVFKPQAAIYEQLLARTNYTVSEILHVAGAPSDGRGARDAGFYSALLHHAPLPGTQPCFTLANITLLPDILI
eukprot:m.7762 g.7762  ORF g.7762 m.7762 type:complete len:266 (+) comp5286_c0_seq1:64-861(+)